ncbi:MAG TPA: type II secretion system protein GspJ [Myxococcaceae bacterium]|nr:type II secretion system protein GspJ [Myxococcaceae bacterium]
MRLDARGFTLIEVMIAVGITALMGGLVAASFQTSMRAKEEVEAEADRYRMLRAATSRMTREVGAAFVSDRYDPKRYRDAYDRPTNFIGAENKLLFTSLAHQRLYTDAKESDQMVVEYSVKTSTDPDAKGRQDLVRRVNPAIGEPMDRGGTEDVLYEGVKGFELAYWDSEKKEWDDEWDTRKPERRTILPTRVRITLTANDESDKEVRYVTQTRVVLNTELPRN